MKEPSGQQRRWQRIQKALQRNVFVVFAAVAVCAVPALATPKSRREAKRKPEYGASFSTEITASQETVEQAVEAIVNDGIIQGSKEYNKEKYIEKAQAASSSPLFEPYKGPGKVYYKVRTEALAPANFKETQDEGTVAVRYIVTSKGPLQTVLQIEALFAEDFRRVVHPSDGSVENAEYRDIQDRVDAMELERKQAEENERHRQEELAKKALAEKNAQQAAAAVARADTANTPEQRVEALRRQAERVVKASGAQLKSAPFHSATNLKTLPGGSEVVILITTPYWFGVETESGEHGWINHSQLEFLP